MHTSINNYSANQKSTPSQHAQTKAKIAKMMCTISDLKVVYNYCEMLVLCIL